VLSVRVTHLHLWSPQAHTHHAIQYTPAKDLLARRHRSITQEGPLDASSTGQRRASTLLTSNKRACIRTNGQAFSSWAATVWTDWLSPRVSPARGQRRGGLRAVLGGDKCRLARPRSLKVVDPALALQAPTPGTQRILRGQVSSTAPAKVSPTLAETGGGGVERLFIKARDRIRTLRRGRNRLREIDATL